MDIQMEDRNNWTLLTIDGNITAGAGDSLCNAIAAQIERGRGKIVLDLRKVSYMDSLGMGQLAGGYTMLAEVGGGMALVGANDKIKTLLKLTGIETHIRGFSTFEEAARSLGES